MQPQRQNPVTQGYQGKNADVVCYYLLQWTKFTTDAFELWCLRVPWTARRSNQSFLKEINPEYSLEGLMLKLKLQYLATWCEELTHWKRPWCWERLRAGREGDDRGWDGWMAPGDGQGQGSLACCSPWGHNESDMMSNWTTTTLRVESILINIV